MEVQFKEYTSKEKKELLDMMTAFNEIDGYHFDREIGEKNLSGFTDDKTLGRLFIITHQSKVIGYIILTFGFSFEYKGRDAFIDEFFIKEGYRGQGIGKQAMHFIEEEAIKLNVRAIHLEVESHNKNANKLYLNHGFKANNRELLTKKL